MAQGSNLYALLIGINDYESQAVRRLSFAVADVLAFREFMRERMNLNEGNCILLSNPIMGPVGTPNRAEVLYALHQISSAPMREEDVFILYFAGHGFAVGEETYLLTTDSRIGSVGDSIADRRRLLRDTAVSLTTLRSYLRSIRAGEQLVILDACRHEPFDLERGSAAAALDAVMARDIAALAKEDVSAANAAQSHFQARAILCSCWEGQVSYEFPGARHGWFCHNLLECLRSDPRGELDVVELRERVRARMQMNAWRMLPEAKKQEPWVVVEGRPVRLRMVPLRVETKSESAVPPPDKVEIKEVTIAPLEVHVEQVQKEQVSLPGLPPIPTDILELEGELEGLQQAIRALEEETHPSLRSAQTMVLEAETQLKRLEEDLAAHIPEIPEGLKRRLLREVIKNPSGSVSALCEIASNVPVEALLPYVLRLRNIERARRAWKITKEQYNSERRREVDTLKERARAVEKRLLARQGEDLKSVLEVFFGMVGETAEFPLEAWIGFTRLLEKRRYCQPAKEILRTAEKSYVEWADRWTWESVMQDLTIKACERYLALHPEGRHVSKAREFITQLGDARAWQEAESKSTAESYREYLRAVPHGLHAKEARERLAGKLREILLKDIRNVEARKRYLKARTAWWRRQDERRSYWCRFALLMLGIETIAISVAIAIEILTDFGNASSLASTLYNLGLGITIGGLCALPLSFLCALLGGASVNVTRMGELGPLAFFAYWGKVQKVRQRYLGEH